MLDKFIKSNKAEKVRKSLDLVDFSSADILETERDIFAALVRSQRPNNWTATPVAPLAEPVDLTALVGDLLNESRDEIKYHVGRVDNIYLLLSDLNNTLKSEVESVERQVTQASDDIQDISLVIGDENISYFWISDSFNNNSFVDPDRTTCLVDTDYGMTTLSPINFEVISTFSAQIDQNETLGVPGANLVILNEGKHGLQDQEPLPILESTETRNFGAIFDSDPNTWFEIERNFIPQKQKLMRQGRAFVSSEAGIETDVKEATKDLDWKVIVEWPNGLLDGGADGKGKEIAEFRNLDLENPLNQQNPNVHLVFDIVLDSPSQISSLRLLPFQRETGTINVDSIRVLVGDVWVDVVRDVQLGSNRSTTRLQREILRRTGVQTTGSIYAIPTDREISRIRVSLSAQPQAPKYGFGHLFQDVQTEYRTERNHGLWRTVNKWREWGRIPINKEVPRLKSSNDRPKLVGTLINSAGAIGVLGRVYKNLTAPAALGGAGLNLTGSLGAVGAWLGKAVPIVGAILALDQLVGGLFSVKKSEKVRNVKQGYDVFKGYRAAIALRDLTILKTQYVAESVIQSVKREFAAPVSKVGLFVDEYVPESWGPGDWITYYVSVDGTNWVPMPKLTDTTLEKSLVLDTPTSTLFFKAILKGNPDDIYHSPALRHYSLQGLPA